MKFGWKLLAGPETVHVTCSEKESHGILLVSDFPFNISSKKEWLSVKPEDALPILMPKEIQATAALFAMESKRREQ